MLGAFLLVNLCSNNVREIQTILNIPDPDQTTLKANKTPDFTTLSRWHRNFLSPETWWRSTVGVE
jgi:hypothetical protein